MTNTTTTLNPTDYTNLIYQLANRYANKGIDVDDLISEGMLELSRIADQYDPEKGAPTTFITTCVVNRFKRLFCKQRRTLTSHQPASADESPMEPMSPSETPQIEIDELLSLIDRLPPKLQTVLIMRFGLGGQSVQTLVQVGQFFNVGKERARQLETEALDMLRAFYR